MSCGTLTAGFAYDCANPIKGGINGTALYIFNYEDWQAATITRTNNTITAISFAGGATGFAIEQPGTSNITSTYEFAETVGIPQFKHIVNFLVAADTSASSELVQKLSAGSYVAAYITNDNRIKVLGEDSGLKLTPQEIKNYGAAASSWSLQLASRDEMLEAQLPTYFVGSAPSNFNTTKTEFLALIA